MKLFGLTIASTKKLGDFRETIERLENDIELRKWCIELCKTCGRCDERVDNIFRYIATGDAAMLERNTLRSENNRLEQENEKLKEDLASLQG